MSNEVPEGQVPRDKAFWRTFRAVEADREARFRRADCLSARQHKLVMTSREPVHCGHCDADWGRILADTTSWRLEQRFGFGRWPEIGDVLYQPGDVVWHNDHARVVKDRVLIEQGDDGRPRWTITMHPADHPLPSELRMPTP